MQPIWIVLVIIGIILSAALVITYICFRMAFLVTRKQKREARPLSTPEGNIYGAYTEQIKAWCLQTDALPHEDFSIRSFDGLTLWGKYYEYAPGAPIELMFHGYRGTSRRDLSGGVQRCAKLGRSALIVDQRGSGRSDGNIITFGVNESKDCLKWVDFMIDHFGADVKIHLTGISMGAATVMMAAGHPLPPNVVGVLADCGYTSAKEIICQVIQQMHLPPMLAYPFVKLAARTFAGFDLEENPPIEAVKNCSVPLILVHGEEDKFVPCHMSRRTFDACRAPRKKLVTVPGAGHGLSYVVEPELYVEALRQFHPEEQTGHIVANANIVFQE